MCPAVIVPQVFNQVHEYLSRGSLDLSACISAAAEVQGERLRITLQGDPRVAGAAIRAGTHNNGSSSGGNASSKHNGGGGATAGGVAPAHLTNDINLLTLLDSMRLMQVGATNRLAKDERLNLDTMHT